MIVFSLGSARQFLLLYLFSSALLCIVAAAAVGVNIECTHVLCSIILPNSSSCNCWYSTCAVSGKNHITCLLPYACSYHHSVHISNIRHSTQTSIRSNMHMSCSHRAPAVSESCEPSFITKANYWPRLPAAVSIQNCQWKPKHPATECSNPHHCWLCTAKATAGALQTRTPPV